MNKLVFLHGMESSPLGTKSQFIKKHYPECLIPELMPDIHKRMTVIEELIKKPVFLVGSSLGGLSALLFAMSHPEMVRGMILIAPAVGFFDQTVFNDNDKKVIRQTYIPAGIPCSVMIGKKDTVIPESDIKTMIERSPDKDQIKVFRLDDDHTLNQSLDLLLSQIRALMDRD
ncbi:MAG: YqiA/YcfP family alpha/beta fold hydrolase [bacterium]